MKVGFFFSFLVDPFHVDDIVFLGDFVKAAKVCSKFCARDSKLWEDWIFVFEEKKHLQVCINSHFFCIFRSLTFVFHQAIIPYVPIESPRLDHLVYELILAHFLIHDRQVSLFFWFESLAFY